MKRIILLTILLLFSTTLFSQDSYHQTDTSKYYSFNINYWSNLHHFLWLEAFLNKDVDSTIISRSLPEAAHHLILGSSYFVGGTIKDLTEVMKVKPPRQLGNAYLFYFTGQLTKQLLAQNNIDYPATYMERNRVFSHYFPLLEKYLSLYMEREITLVEATKRIIEDLRK